MQKSNVLPSKLRHVKTLLNIKKKTQKLYILEKKSLEQKKVLELPFTTMYQISEP